MYDSPASGAQTATNKMYMLELFYCMTAVFLFLVGNGYIRINMINAVRRRFSSLQRCINDLSAEINEQTDVLKRISMVDEFAAYFKKKRIIDKLNDELKQLIKKRDTQELAAGFAWKLLGKAVCMLFALWLAAKSTHLTVTRIGQWHFWPLGWLLAYPASSSNVDQEGTVPVSLFTFSIMLFFVGRTFCTRVLQREVESTSSSVSTSLMSSLLRQARGQLTTT